MKPTRRESRELGVILDNLEGWERGEGQKHFANFKTQRYWRRIITAELVAIDDEYSEVVDI